MIRRKLSTLEILGMKIIQFIKMKKDDKDIYRDIRKIILMIYIQLGFGLGSYFGTNLL